MKEIREQINNYEITIIGNICKVRKSGKVIYDDILGTEMTALEVFNAITAKKKFSLNNKTLELYTIFGSSSEKEQSTLELLAYENNCDIKDIKITKVLEQVTSHAIL